jgi:hypothetical protein
MLCRHNRFVQEYGRLRDPDEIARRERLWEKAISKMEFETGRKAASIGADEFRQLLAREIDLKAFHSLKRGSEKARSEYSRMRPRGARRARL